MANMSLKKVAMPEQDPNVRNKNFEEVALGYTKEMAMEEAARCLNCKNKPCVGGCPVNVPIPAFIEKVAAGDFEGAYEVITTENALPAICGRVCPQENQCDRSNGCSHGQRDKAAHSKQNNHCKLRWDQRQYKICHTVGRGSSDYSHKNSCQHKYNDHCNNIRVTDSLTHYF